jgi:hypothetical protein
VLAHISISDPAVPIIAVAVVVALALATYTTGASV